MADKTNEMSSSKPTACIAARERGPGAGRYKLPSTCGFLSHDYSKHMQPAYSFGKRLSDYAHRTDCSPGPVYRVDSRVSRVGNDGTPSYSIHGRQKHLKTFKTPAPGTYMPEKVHPPGERYAAAYSISYRTRYRKRDPNPAPSRYQLPQLLGSKQPCNRSYPSYSMISRGNVGSYTEDLSKTPGPGQYNAVRPNVIREKQAEYSLKGRSKIPSDSTNKPGPGAYSPEKVSINKPSIPKATLGIRHSEFVSPLLIPN